jgi:hypothetical protein
MPRPGSLAFLAAAFLALVAARARADEVLLKDGRSFEGKIEKETKDQVAIQTRFGRMEFTRAEISEIKHGKTTEETFEERWQAAKSAADYYDLGLWCQEKKIKNEAKRCMKRAIELEPDHEGARTYLGFVRYEGEWMTPEERDAKVRAKEEADMAAQGFVRHGDRWVTLEEKAKLDQGLVLVDGKWLAPDEAMRKQGFDTWNGQWLPRSEALSQADVDHVEEKLGLKLVRAKSEYAIVAGPFPLDFLRSIALQIDAGRRWFHEVFALAADDPFAGDRLPQFYAWGRDSTPYVDTCEWFASLTKTVPAGWADGVKKIHGFVWWDPYCVSSARLWNRPDDDIAGHCYHHSGHLLLNRLGYDGRLLPPWYDEGFAAEMEFHTHDRNAVFCIAHAAPVETGGGTSARKIEFQFETMEFRGGSWRKKLADALASNEVPPFDQLAKKEFGELTRIDIATSMAILEWLLTQEGALARFHKVVRETSPKPPLRVIFDGNERRAVYDRAFGAAVQLSMRSADQAWREWFRNRK